MKTLFMAAAAVIVAISFGTSDAHAQKKCGPPKPPKSAAGKCIKANGGQWGLSPYSGKCRWWTHDSAMGRRCGGSNT